MSKIRIELHAEDLSLDRDPIEIESDVNPHAGELIDGDVYVKKPSGASPYYIVSSVIYELTEVGFILQVTAHTWYKGVRSELLQKRGWLPLVHDEDDGHRADPLPDSLSDRPLSRLDLPPFKRRRGFLERAVPA
jgi:hypothetical protein